MLLTLLLLLPSEPPKLPPPDAGASVKKFAKVIGWPAGKTPTAPAGFKVTLFADKLQSPRWLTVLPNGDVLVAEAKTPPKADLDAEKRAQMTKSKMMGEPANRITLLRGGERHVFAEKLNLPFGMGLIGDTLYVGTTDAVLAFDYKPGQLKLEGAGRRIMALPAGGYNNHWTRNLLANTTGTELYVTVGSASNVGEHGMKEEEGRACIHVIDTATKTHRIFASGLRNPVGLAWQPQSGALWTAVNERDELGDELVPDYITSVKDGGFYGWPYSYFGQSVDPRRQGERPDLVAKAIVPDFALGAHTASLGLAFETAGRFPQKYAGGAFIGQHGSWNRSTFSGYRVAFVPFKDGQPSGPAEDFLSGFIANADDVYGRPVGVAFAKDGALLVADDAGNCIWRVEAR